MNYAQELGKQIKAARQAQGLRQEDLAERCEVKKAQISKIEADVRHASMSTFLKIREVLSLDLQLYDEAASPRKTTVQQSAAPLNFRAEQIRPQLANDVQRVEHMSYIRAFDYCCGKLKSAKRMYNTTFSVDQPLADTYYYQRWIQSIVEGITDHNCIICEVLLSQDRYLNVCNTFKSYNKPLKGSYIAIDLSSEIDKLREIPLIEITLFEFDRDVKEVIFGWSLSKSGLDNTDSDTIRAPGIVTPQELSGADRRVKNHQSRDF
jgi:transcriptional regulator with XRE-family HTH domain